jgi:hypothetical protein
VLIAVAASAVTAGASAAQEITAQTNIALFTGGLLCIAALAVVLIFVLPKKHQLSQ